MIADTHNESLSRARKAPTPPRNIEQVNPSAELKCGIGLYKVTREITEVGFAFAKDWTTAICDADTYNETEEEDADLIRLCDLREHVARSAHATFGNDEDGKAMTVTEFMDRFMDEWNEAEQTRYQNELQLNLFADEVPA